MFDYKGSFQQESASNMSTMDLAACPHILHPYFHPRVDKKSDVWGQWTIWG